MRRLLWLLPLVLLAACGDVAATQTPVVIVVTATPLPATPLPPTAAPPSVTPIPPTPLPPTPNLAVTAAAEANMTYVAGGFATATEEALHPPPTYTAVAPPTAAPAPSFGDTITLADWTISLAKQSGPKATIDWSAYGNGFQANGAYWLLYVDARNGTNTTRALADSLRWALLDDRAARYPEMASGPDSYAMGEFATLNGRTPQDVGTTPRGLTHPVLVFDVAADAKPAQLLVTDGSDTVLFTLTKKR